MARRIAVIQGHPDPHDKHFGHATAVAYAKGAESVGHEVRFIYVAKLDFSFLHTKEEFEKGTPVDAIRLAQETIHLAEHLVVSHAPRALHTALRLGCAGAREFITGSSNHHPLWLGTMPAILKAFLEQTLRPGFAFAYADGKGMPKK
ncbi:MAG: NAD(P)H-dependent oxidoreductase [Pseudomonadota bacterium]